MALPINDVPVPNGDPKAPSLQTYLESVLAARKPDSFASPDHTDLNNINTRIERLKYMLLHTLGCPDTFEFRRQELAILKKIDDDSSTNNNDKGTKQAVVTDESILESFLYEIEHPDGSLRQYLEHADVVAIVGHTLFAHGAVDASTMMFVPRYDSKFENPTRPPPPGKICTSVVDWADALNEYLKRGLQDYAERPLWCSNRVTRGGESLMALQNRPAMWGRSIVSNCYGDGGVITTVHAAEHRNDPKRVIRQETDPLMFEKVSSDPMDSNVASWLLDQGIRRVVVGHKPTGDCPAVLSAACHGVEIVSADTSYSGSGAVDKNGSSSNSDRGAALSVVEIVGDSALDNRLEISGRLRDGTDYHNLFHRLTEDGVDETVGDYNLGKKIAGEWWIKAATADHYRLCRGKGRNVEYKSILKSQLDNNRECL